MPKTQAAKPGAKLAEAQKQLHLLKWVTALASNCIHIFDCQIPQHAASHHMDIPLKSHVTLMRRQLSLAAKGTTGDRKRERV